MILSKQNKLKKKAALKALDFIKEGMIVGVGTGSTVKYFIEGLAKMKTKIEYAVSSSEQSTKLLKKNGIEVVDLNFIGGKIDIYIDGADECDGFKNLIKGGGAALTREKILASSAKEFICIIDESKKVDILGTFPLPVEVIKMSRTYVSKKIIEKIGGQPLYREGVITDNGNFILDVYNLKIMEALKIEQELNNIAGVVCNGIFSQRKADKVIVASEKEILVF